MEAIGGIADTGISPLDDMVPTIGNDGTLIEDDCSMTPLHLGLHRAPFGDLVGLHGLLRQLDRL